jgi:plasmid stabilization system protein ParE
MPRLRWSQSALIDTTRLYEFLASKSPDAAKRAAQSIRQGVKLLAKYPEVGRPIEGMPPELREWVIQFGHGGYVALYRYDGEEGPDSRRLSWSGSWILSWIWPTTSAAAAAGSPGAPSCANAATSV